MRTPAIIDGRNGFEQKDFDDRGFENRAVGKSGIKRT
jgi:hypothetical protein